MVLPGSNSAAAYTEKTLYTFCSARNCTDGAQPYGELAMDSDGNLYGITPVGGANNGGAAFELAAGTGKYSVLYNFCGLSGCTDGKLPLRVKLVIDTAGNLYGTTEAGGDTDGGVVFELHHKRLGWEEKILHTFCPRPKSGCPDGALPYDGLTYAGAAAGQPYDGSSPLYGTTNNYGAHAGGTVFAVEPITGTKKWKESVLYSFCSQDNCTDGENPDTPLYVDTEGNIYGTTPGGGQSGGGTVFELSPNEIGYTESVLYNFCAQANCSDGKEPQGGVVMDSAGNLYGTATEGGDSNNDGVIFSLFPDGSQWQFNLLDEFDRRNGSAPIGMLLDASGNLFGTTYEGGANGKTGSVFEFNGSIQVLYSFCSQTNCPDGRHPIAGVIEDGAGNLYGTTQNGGHHRSGTIYELSK
jgi:uncharacterized repeat protein (TIGR03803 family)